MDVYDLKTWQDPVKRDSETQQAIQTLAKHVVWMGNRCAEMNLEIAELHKLLAESQQRWYHKLMNLITRGSWR